MNTIRVANLPEPAGHYSHAVVHDGIVYVSGQLPMRDGSTDLVQGSIEGQTAQAIENLKRVLEAAGSRLELVLRTTVYVADIALWDRVNRVYAASFGNHKPARAVVPTRELHHGFLVEIDAVAAVAD